METRGRLALALDVDDLVVAVRLARELRPFFGVAKVGLELFSAAGPEAVTALLERDVAVFLDRHEPWHRSRVNTRVSERGM